MGNFSNSGFSERDLDISPFKIIIMHEGHTFNCLVQRFHFHEAHKFRLRIKYFNSLNYYLRKILPLQLQNLKKDPTSFHN